MIELNYINEDVSETKYFKTWKSLDKFVMSQELKKYKVKGQSPAEGNIIKMVKAFKRLTGKKI